VGVLLTDRLALLAHMVGTFRVTRAPSSIQQRIEVRNAPPTVVHVRCLLAAGKQLRLILLINVEHLRDRRTDVLEGVREDTTGRITADQTDTEVQTDPGRAYTTRRDDVGDRRAGEGSG
jgi:hypothetical protein